MHYFALVLFAVLCIVGIGQPAWAMVLLLVMFPLEVSLQASIGLFRSQGALANVLVAAVVGLSVLLTTVRQPRPFLGHAGMPLLLLLIVLGWSFLSLLWSPAEPRAANEGINIIIEGLPYFVVFILLGPLLVGSIQDWRRMTNLMLIVGSLVAVSIVLGPEFTIKQGRIGVGLEGVQRTSPLALGQLGGMLAIFAALSAGGRVTGLQTTIRWSAFIIGALLALFSGTRGQAIFAIASIALFLPVSRRLRNLGGYFSLVATAAVVGLGAFITFNYVLGQADTDRWRPGALLDAVAVRQWSVLELLRAFLESPMAWMVGLGYNAFSTLSGAGDLGYVHNIFAEVLCELGLPIFVVFMLFFVQTARHAMSLFQRYREHAAERSAVAILMAMILYQALIMTKEGNLWSAWTLFLFMLITSRVEMRVAELGDATLERESDAEEADGSAMDPRAWGDSGEPPPQTNLPPHGAVPAA